MSGTASVPTQFQAAVTATGLQLDNNFNTIVGYLNDPTNRTNYAADGGTTNTLIINPSPAMTNGYSAGLTILFRASITNTGAVVANVNSLGNASVFDQQGRQLTVSAIVAGGMYAMSHNGTSGFMLLSPNSIVASQPALVSLTSGVGTYTVSSGAVRIRVRGVGGGGGGAFNAAASAGGGTRFGILLAGGGAGGRTTASGGTGGGGAGGTATGATIIMQGGSGNACGAAGSIGGNGGASAFGGGGGGGNAGVTAVPSAPTTGGGGGGEVDATQGGGGGGAGAYFEHNFVPPATTYSYTVGAGGANGGGGGTGAVGIILIETFFA